MEPIDLGHDHTARFFVWDPDLELNPQHRDAPGSADEYVGAIIAHLKPDGSTCSGAIHFDTERVRYMAGNPNRWTLHSLDPLHVEPSVLCNICGDHGFIRDGKWQPA